MTITNRSIARTNAFIIAGIVIVASIGAGSAETYRYGGSTAVIEQSGGGKSTSWVTRYRDGQRIITHDGHSTDITIQRQGRFAESDSDEKPYDRFDYPFDRERFSRVDPYDRDRYFEREPCLHAAFKQRMFDRMRVLAPER